MYNMKDAQRIAESVIRRKALKEELSNQINSFNNEEFFDLLDAMDNDSFET